MNKIACKLCILSKGLKGSDIKDLPDEDDEDGFAKHLILVHGLIVEGYNSQTGEKLAE